MFGRMHQHTYIMSRVVGFLYFGTHLEYKSKYVYVCVCWGGGAKDSYKKYEDSPFLYSIVDFIDSSKAFRLVTILPCC